MQYAAPRSISTIENCFFYHSMDVPGHGHIAGLSDMRPALPYLFDDVNLTGKSVIEIGPASGFFTFEMERRGASVTSIELGPNSDWDYIEHAGQSQEAQRKRWRDQINEMQNSYWFGHQLFGSKARVVNGSAYDLGRLGCRGEIGFLANVLVHLRDPIGAIAQLAKVSSETLIICDVEPYTESRALAPLRWLSRAWPLNQFIPRADNPRNDHTWWHLSARTVEQLVAIYGFKTIHIRYFESLVGGGARIKQWAVIASRQERGTPSSQP